MSDSEDLLLRGGGTNIEEDRRSRCSSGVNLNWTSKHAFVGKSGYVKQWMSGE